MAVDFSREPDPTELTATSQRLHEDRAMASGREGPEHEDSPPVVAETIADLHRSSQEQEEAQAAQQDPRTPDPEPERAPPERTSTAMARMEQIMASSGRKRSIDRQR